MTLLDYILAAALWLLVIVAAGYVVLMIVYAIRVLTDKD